MEMTQQQVNAMVQEALEAARAASLKYFQDELGGEDQYACGFAWVELPKVKGNTRLGRQLKQAGVEQNWQRRFHIWNPSGLGVQNIDCKEEGAYAAAAVFKRYGVEAYASSRLD